MLQLHLLCIHAQLPQALTCAALCCTLLQLLLLLLLQLLWLQAPPAWCRRGGTWVPPTC